MALKAGIVARVSRSKPDDSGRWRGGSVDQQEAAGREACTINGWDVLEPVYGHTGSASRFAKKDNPQWVRLQADLPRLGVVVMWEPSRGQRNPVPWLVFLNECRERGILIHVVTHGRTYDMGVSRDWRTLAEDGIDAAYESEKTSERTRRGLRVVEADGKPVGQTPYGYRRAHNVKTGKYERQYPDPAESEVVHRIIRDVAARIPLSVIARELEANGVPPPGKQKMWYRVTVRRIAENPAYAAKLKTADGLTDGSWPAIVAWPEFMAARRVLQAVDRSQYQGDFRPGETRYLLTGIAVCAVCGEALVAKRLRIWQDESGDTMREANYRCRPGHIAIPETELDEFVESVVLKKLSEPGVWKRFAPASDAEQAEALEAVAALKDTQREVEAGVRSKAIPVASGARMLRDLERDIAAAQRHADDLAAPAIAGVWPNLDRWYSQPLPFRRFVIRELFDRIEVGRRGEPDRIRVQ